MSAQVSRLLRGVWKSKPLSTVKQGSTLSIKSFPDVNLHVRIISQWREDAQLSLQQIMPACTSTTSETEDGTLADSSRVRVYTNTDGMKTSMGRVENMTFVDVGLTKDMVWPPETDLLDSANDGSAVDTVDGYTLLDEKSTESSDEIAGMPIPKPNLVLTAKVPEKLNFQCQIQGNGSIFIEKKLEGDVELTTHAGHIFVSKVRGHLVSLTSKRGGVISVKKMIEGQDVTLTTSGRLRAKMVNGSSIDINVRHEDDEKNELKGDSFVTFDTDEHGRDVITHPENTTSTNSTLSHKLDADDKLSLIDISSLYAFEGGDGAHLEVESNLGGVTPRGVRVKSNHGHVSVRASVPPIYDEEAMVDEFDQAVSIVELGGVNGSCDVSVETHLPTNEVRNEQTKPAADFTAASVHVDQLSPGTVSAVTADAGTIGLTIDRKVETDVRFLSCPEISSFDADVILDDDLVDIADAIRAHDDQLVATDCPVKGNVQVRTDAFTRATTTNNEGSEESNEAEAEPAYQHQHVQFVNGQMHNRSNEPASRFDVKVSKSTGGKVNSSGSSAQALQGFSGQDNNADGGQNDSALLAAATSGTIVVESVSWFGAIARRYGLDDEQRHELGRQAKAGGAKQR
eukprot:CAMPEP_0194397920 /NCGR_PEP_ID=MMETSP0174-20130528/125813_1 /TAXON_ID=216777 /ORGANISM="Proboscia alata, Strain PI-D3" /LENGTH=625 /DNA_ID=CAMNT_0039194153 /DNA_START=199 /DNA_END=2076 /DNA_ORIENTATION=+